MNERTVCVRQGFLDERDLTQYAERNGLPAQYAPYFMTAVLQNKKLDPGRRRIK